MKARSGLSYLPLEEWAAKYHWRVYEDYLGLGPTALVTHHNCDVFIELLNGEPQWVDPELNPELMYGLKPAAKLAKYVKMWIKSGFFRSVHLKEFLNQVAPNE